MAPRVQKPAHLGEQPREWLPARRWLPKYQRRWLKGDIVAGSVVAALAIPQSLGYATIAGLPVQVGLYSLPTVLVVYALLGTSRLLIVGPVSTVALLTGTLVAGFQPESQSEAVALAAGMAITAGLLLMLASVLHVGWVAEFLSKPIVTGFVLGLTILVIIGELPNILGIPVPPGDVGQRIKDLVTGLDEIHPQTVVVGVVALALMFGGTKLAPKVPWALVTLMVGLVASNILDLAADGVRVVGEVPQGLPTPALPGIPVSDWMQVVVAGAAVAFVGLAEGLSAARLYATEDSRIDASQELLAVGVGNVSSGIFGGFGVAGSLSKTATVDRAGGRSQVAGLTTAALALATILFLAPALSALPKATLSAIVIHAVWGLLDFKSMRRYAFLRRNDIVAATVAAIGVLAFGPLQGLLLAIGLSVFGLVYRSSRVDVEVMGRVPGEKAAWGGMRNHPERRGVKGILVLRVDVPLFWVNSASVKDAILARVDGVKDWTDQEIVAVVVDIEGTNQIDTTTIDMLDSLLAALRERCVDLYLVRVMYPVRVVLRRAGFVAKIGEDHMWHTISQGTREARIHYGLKEGVVDAAGGYDSSAEEHEERIVPKYFADSRADAEAEGVDATSAEVAAAADSDAIADIEAAELVEAAMAADGVARRGGGLGGRCGRGGLRRPPACGRGGADAAPPGRRASRVAHRHGRGLDRARAGPGVRGCGRGGVRGGGGGALLGCPPQACQGAQGRQGAEDLKGLGPQASVVLRLPSCVCGGRHAPHACTGVPLMLPVTPPAPVAIDVADRYVRPLAGREIRGLAWAGQDLLVLDARTGRLALVDPATDGTRVVNEGIVESFIGGGGLALTDAEVWFTTDAGLHRAPWAADAGGSAARARVATPALVLPVEGATAVAVLGGRVHLVRGRTLEVREIGALDVVVAQVELHGIGQKGIAATDDALWLTDDLEQTVYCLDPITLATRFMVVTPLERPTAIAARRLPGDARDTLHVAYYENEPYLSDNPWIDPSWEVRYRDRALIHPLRVHHDPGDPDGLVDRPPHPDALLRGARAGCRRRAPSRRPVAAEPAHREPSPADGGGGADRPALRDRGGGRPARGRVLDPERGCRHPADPGMAGHGGGLRRQAPADRRGSRRSPGAAPRDGCALPDRR